MEILSRLYPEQSEASSDDEASPALVLEAVKMNEDPSPEPRRDVEIIVPLQKLEIDNSPEPEIVEAETEEMSLQESEIIEALASPPLELSVVEHPVVFEPQLEEPIDEIAISPIEISEDELIEQEVTLVPQTVEQDEVPTPTIETTTEPFEQQISQEHVAVAIFENIESRISELEPEKAEATARALSRIVEITPEIQNIEVDTPGFEKAEEELIELCSELLISLELDYSEEETRQVVRLWIAYSRLNFPIEENTDNNFSHLFDDMGTHEGLRQFMVGLRRLKRIVKVIYSALGKFALNVFQAREEYGKRFVIQPAV